MKRAVFIDRDGVINEEMEHPELVDNEGRMCTDVITPDEFSLLEGAKEGFRILKEAGILTVVISNQAGVPKGFLTEGALKDIDKKMREKVEPDAVYYCLHHEDYTGACECKKPKKGLLHKAVKNHDIDISKSYMVGDRRIDMQFGSDCRQCFYVDSRERENAQKEVAKLSPQLQNKITIVKNLKEAAELIIND